MTHVIPETAEEAKSEIGISDWIDPDTHEKCVSATSTFVAECG